MLLNEAKTKTMIFNYTNNHQFSTRLSVNEKNIQVVENTKLLGTILSDDLKWDLNTDQIINKKAYARML